MITNNKIPRTQLESDKGLNVIYRDFTISSALTGTTAITLIKSALIPANTVTVNDEVEIRARALRSTTTGNASHYFYYNTSNSLSGATLIATATAASAYFGTTRNLYIKSATESETLLATASASSSDTNASAALGTSISSLNINWTSDVYIIQAFANAAVGDSTASRGLIITRSRL